MQGTHFSLHRLADDIQVYYANDGKVLLSLLVNDYNYIYKERVRQRERVCVREIERESEREERQRDLEKEY